MRMLSSVCSFSERACFVGGNMASFSHVPIKCTLIHPTSTSPVGEMRAGKIGGWMSYRGADSDKRTRVLMVGGQELIQIGLHTILTSEEGIAVVGNVTECHDVHQACQRLKPDVLVVGSDILPSSLAEMMARRNKHHPEVKVLAMLVHAYNDAEVYDLVALGVEGCVDEGATQKEVISAIYTVVQGGSWFSRTVVERLLREETKDPILTYREKQVLEMIAKGWSNASIATELKLAEQTVRNYSSHIYSKLYLRSRAEAIIWARKRGMGRDNKPPHLRGLVDS